MRRLSCLLLFAVMALPVAAQNTDIEALSGLQFDFGNPGARALGMGGAFIGLADDASAAEANPAGLTILRKSEASVEARRTTISQTFGTGGYWPNVTTTDFPADATALSFASVVIPAGRWSLALYHHSPLEFDNTVDLTSAYPTPTYYVGPNGPLTRDACAADPNCITRQIYPYSTSVSLDLETWGVALAFDLGKVSIGGAARYHTFKESSSSHRVDLDLPGPPTFLILQRNASGAWGGKDSDVTWVAGLKWEILDNLSLGAVYKKGPDFPTQLYASDVTSGEGAPLDAIAMTRFEVPDVGGVGVSWRPAPALTLNLDVISIAYSRLTNEFVSLMEVKYSDGQLQDLEQVSGYESDDVVEVHTGVEYFVPTRIPLAIRTGWWRDPSHAMVFRGPLLVDHDIAASILFPEQPAQNHFTFGLGLSMPGWQIDAGYDYSERLKIGSISAVVRF